MLFLDQTLLDTSLWGQNFRSLKYRDKKVNVFAPLWSIEKKVFQ